MAVDMEEEKNRERKERIDTIFMYESRIKGNLNCHLSIRALLMMWSAADVRTCVLWNLTMSSRTHPVYDFYQRYGRSFSSKIGCWEDYIYPEILTYQMQIIYF